MVDLLQADALQETGDGCTFFSPGETGLKEIQHGMEAWWVMNVAAFCVLAMSALGAGSRGYVLEFSSQGCGPCRQIAPIVAKLEREGLPIRSIDVDEERQLANQYQVESIPTFILIVDGQEVDRFQGPRPESEIRQLLARIPAPNRGDRLPVVLGESAPLPRPEVDIQKEPRLPLASNGGDITEEKPDKPFWPFSKPKKKQQDIAPEIRGNSPERTFPAGDSISAASASNDPMGASVRIRLITGNTIIRGSGTIIESVSGKATILSCNHICRDATDETKIEVDFFRNGEPVTILGTIVGTDPDADVGVLSVSTDEIWPTCRIALLEQIPPIGSQVSSIGCGQGADPSREQIRITELNKFDGPDTVICSGIPIEGRSGGGLFDQKGQLVGVCFAADADPKTRKPNGGVYCGLRPIHALLAKHGFDRLLPSNEPAVSETAELASNDEDAPRAAWSDTPSDSPKSTKAPPEKDIPQIVDASTEDQPSAETISLDELATSDAEVMVVIRRRNGGQEQNKVIMIHKPSQKFLAFVEGETLGKQPKSSTSTARPAKPFQSEAPTRRIVKAKPSSKLLLPTGMKTQIVPSKRSPQPERP